MKKQLLFFILLATTLNCQGMDKCNPGCVRQNSDEIRRDLLFMHIEDSHWDLLYSLLDIESIFFTDRSGKVSYKNLMK